MRLSFLLCTAAFLPLAAAADTIEARSKITSVTIFPWGATVVRTVEFDAPEGVHDLIVPDLPAGMDRGSLRVAGAEGLAVGAVNLATGRLPAAEVGPSDEVKAAEAEVERLEAVVRARDDAIAAIRLRVDAANEQWAFLRSLGQAKAGEAVESGDVDSLRAMTQLVGEEVLKARQAALDAEVEAREAQRAKEADVEALEEARRVLAALVADSQGRSVLSMAVESGGGPTSVQVTSQVQNASWQPVYDLRLDSRTGEMELERSVVVSQSTGEDWRGVALVLSTAQPSGQSAPGRLYPRRLRIDEDRPVDMMSDARAAAGGIANEMAPAAPMAAPEPVMVAAGADLSGFNVVYRYGNAVDVRDGVDGLRLKLDTLEMEAEIAAVAVPALDDTAYLVAEITNQTGEILLPGPAQLYLDGGFVGEADLAKVAGGDSAEMGFGPIEGIRLTQTVPDQSEGSRGLIVSSNQRDVVTLLKVENLTGQSWPIRLMGQVPYSEQDDLEIDWRATPTPTQTDMDGERGILAWEFDLGAGQAREVRVEQSITWPDGYVLR